jgi:hypothetical protein
MGVCDGCVRALCTTASQAVCVGLTFRTQIRVVTFAAGRANKVTPWFVCGPHLPFLAAAQLSACERLTGGWIGV